MSPEASRKFADRLRKPLVPVYIAVAQPALQFTATFAQEIYKSKILPEFTAGNHDQKLLWNSILDSLLSGVLVSIHIAFACVAFKNQ